MGHGMFFGTGWFFGLFIIVCLFGLLFMIFNRNRNNGFHSSETPFEILKKRYARGEISKEQFEEMRKHLE